MSRLAPLDRALVLILVPLYVVFFGLALKTQFDGAGSVFIGLSLADADSYPVLTGEFGAMGPLSPLEEAGLRKGDRLLLVGEADLRGVGGPGFSAHSMVEAGRNLEVAVTYERDGERHEASLPLSSWSTLRPWLAASVAFVASALLLLLRARPTLTVRAYFHAGLCFGFSLCPFGINLLGWHVSIWSMILAQTLLLPLLLRFNLLFPDDRYPGGRWNRVWPWSFAVFGPIFGAMLSTGRYSVGFPAYVGTIVLGGLAILAVVTLKYRSGDPIARRQIRWVVAGTYCATLPLIVASALIAFDPHFSTLWFLSTWALPIVPACLLLSIVRFNLFDVDRVLSAAASYNILGVLLAAGALVAVPRIAGAASGMLGIDPVASQVVLSLALASLVIPAHRRLRPQIDRVFFKERYAVDHGIAELLPTLSRCGDARELTQRVGEGLQRLLRPEACVVYAAVGDSYAPIFAEGRGLPPAFEAGSPLVGTLRRRHSPLSLSAVGRRPDEAALGPFDRAALETLQAELVVPVRQDDALTAFLCLGPKSSGDVYTSTDLSLLTAVAETVSRELRRFDQEQTIREGREMQASLRRYVPGAIAEQIGSGAELVSGEREVSVLFVDLRGYTGFSESRKAEEIFSTVNRYTEAVSQCVHQHAGSVVEFNGDGMMAVFGAPRELAHKERAAVEAGREIVEAVSALPVEGGGTLTVGVGISTGEAFVGNIQAVDRMIWSAIGNTTNLAARLQSMTRELDAVLVIDSTTWERAGSAAEGFAHRPDVPIRGRRDLQNLYVRRTL